MGVVRHFFRTRSWETDIPCEWSSVISRPKSHTHGNSGSRCSRNLQHWSRSPMERPPLRIDRKEGFLERKWVLWLSYFLIWTAVGLFFASESSLWGRYIFRSPVTW